MKKRLLTGLCLAACFALCACSPSPTVLTVGGRKVDAAEYAFYLNYNRPSTGGVDEEGPFDEQATEKAREQAVDQIITGEIVYIKCREHGLKLSSEETDWLSANKADLIESLGGKSAYLEYLGAAALTDRTYDKFQESSLLYDLLYDHIQAESEEAYTSEVLRQYFSENYISVKYIRLATIDDQGEQLTGNEVAEKRALAEQVLSLAQDGTTSFDALVETYNDDPYMSMYPGGIVTSLLEAQGTEYLLPVFELEPGQIGGVYAAADGYYIMLRGTPDARYFEENQDYIYQSAVDARFTELLAQWKSEAEVKYGKEFENINLNNLWDYVK